MTPLNLYVDTADELDLREVLDEYGNAIKQLSAANIFPGDMLLKNFGVTRHGRVVFYDYDEICYLTDVNFRAIPQPSTPEQELSAEVWYTVAPNDVFPEEFRRFLFGRPRIKQIFTGLHGELFDPTYWQGLQAAIRDGQVMDVFPYRRKKRFARQGKPAPGGVTDELTAHGPDEDADPRPADETAATATPPDRAAHADSVSLTLVRAAGTGHRDLAALTALARLALDEFRLGPGERRALPIRPTDRAPEAFLYVVAGSGTLESGGSARAIGAGDFLGMGAPTAAMTLVNTGGETLVCLLGADG
jgi:hypothetical protein